MAPLVGPTSEDPLPGIDIIRIRDWRGVEFGPGNIVLYPRASGRSLEMQEGKVIEIKPVHRDRYNYQTGKEESVTDYKIIIDPIRSSRFAWGNHPSSVEKPVTITIWRNVTAINT